MSAEESVQLVDEAGEPAGSAPRSVMRADNLPHAGTGVFVRRPDGAIYVHQRARTKDWAPGHWDAAAGGVLRAGEDPADNARRELEEELGIAGAELRGLGTHAYADGTTRLFEHLFEVVWDGEIRWPDEEVVEERHPQRSSEEDREGFVAILEEGAESSQIQRRPLIKYTLGGALGLFAIPLGLQLVGSLGPLPGNDLSTSLWDSRINGRKRRLVRDPEGTAIRLSDVTMGSVFHVLPEGIDETEQPLNEKVKASVLLVRLDEAKIKSARQRSWGIDGVVAYSKICTHVGCPVGLYEQQTHHLLCPCHQSTFDMTDDCKVIFGPAKRPLPQLKISVDGAGYLVADQGFAEPVGPSFWERG